MRSYNAYQNKFKGKRDMEHSIEKTIRKKIYSQDGAL
ncbi:hypothetical protein XGA_1937 [Xanthomonas hortorum ATCC 19865]|nr:hypothetical protein XGA_1937 [Xanthomonas hortorum ATCC 19865]